MLKSNLVSVIIPNYNYGSWIEKSILSCLDQGDFLKEIIIVDDHSTDDSIEKIKKLQIRYSDKICLFYNPDKGGNSARNFGFAKSSGEFIQWLDSDDIILSGKFETQLKEFERKDCDIVYSDWQLDYYDGYTFVKSVLEKRKLFNDYLYELLRDNWTCPHNYLLKRNIAEKLQSIQAWDPELNIGQDRYYFTMAAILGARFSYVPGNFSIYNRWSKNTVSGMAFDKWLPIQQVMEVKFRRELQLRYNGNKLNKYIKVLNTNKVKSSFYSGKVKFDRLLMPYSIYWKNFHWKMRMIVPWLLLKGNCQFMISRLLFLIR